jgi:hypothetical protein
MREGLRKIREDPDHLAAARIASGSFRCYVELHIEQGAPHRWRSGRTRCGATCAPHGTRQRRRGVAARRRGLPARGFPRGSRW